MTTVISVENLSKVYRLGQIGTGTFSRDLELWWAKLRGKPNPFLRIGEIDHGNRDGQDLWALNDVSFTVKQGEVLGIIGRNGAGKSTLLKILSRVTAPTTGRVKVKGRIASLLEVGTGFHPELTGRENIYLIGAILGMSKQEITRKFDEIVDFAEIMKFIDTPVKRYSSGMYVRLAFAVAAHLEPEILLVDEVLAVGDADFQKKCLGKMGAVAKEGRTVLFVSHNMGSIKSLCERVIEVKRGSIISDGIAMDVVNKYLFELNENESLENSRKIGEFIKSFTLFDCNHNETTFTETGEPVGFKLEYSTNNAELFDIVVTIGIYSKLGDRIATLRTTHTVPGKRFKNLKGNGEIICNVDSFPLLPGEYVANVAFDGFTVDGKAFHDHIRGSLIIRVIQSNFFGNLYFEPNAPGFLMLKHDWRKTER